MRKKVILTAFAASLIGFSSLTTPVVHATKVLKYSNIKNNPYNAISGYMYKHANLKNKVHNADNYPLTTFYTRKSVQVKRNNGNKAVYYYVINGNGKVKGWIWRGYLVRKVQPVTTKINRIVSLVDSLTNKTLDQVISVLTAFDNNYSNSAFSNLLTALQKIMTQSNNSEDLQNLEKLYNTIQSNQSVITGYIDNILNLLNN